MVQRTKITPPCKKCNGEISGRESSARVCWSCVACAGIDNGQRKAIYAIKKEILAGRLKPAKECLCVDCNKFAYVYDHRDYNKLLDVVPVCSSCNRKRGSAIPLNKEMK
jgi:hypothetical protein